MPLASPTTDNLQAWGTVAGAVIAFLALAAAALAYLGQRKQLADLTKERLREAEERRREQVSKVFVTWDIDDDVSYRVTNNSPYPVYTVRVQLVHEGLVKEQQVDIPHLLPGGDREFYTDMSPSTVEQFRKGTKIAVAEVTDANQNRWRITSQGHIEPIEA